MSTEPFEVDRFSDQRVPTPSSVRDSVVASAVDRLRRGVGTLVTGSAGLGKSSLLDAIALSARRSDLNVGQLTATASTSSVPFGVLLQLIDQAAIERLMATSDDPLRTAAVVRAMVLGLDLDVLVVDDAHLLDAGAVGFVLELVEVGVVVVAAVRPEATGSGDLMGLVRAGRSRLVELTELDLDETARLIARLMGATVDTTLAAHVHRVARGNPLLVREVVEAALSSGAVVVDGGRAGAVKPLPHVAHLADLLGMRVQSLEPPLQTLVEAIAVAEEIAIEAAVDLGAADELSLAHLDRLGWITVDASGRTVRLRRPVVRDALVETITAYRRGVLLRRLVDAVERITRPLTLAESIGLARWRLDLGLSLDRSGDTARGIETALHIAAVTSVTEPDLAERLLREAIDAGGGARAQVRLAAQLKRVGRTDEAATVLGRASASATDERTLDDVSIMLAIIVGIGFRRSREALITLDRQIGARQASLGQHAVRAALLWRERRPKEALLAAIELAAVDDASFASVFAGFNEVLIRATRGQRVEALSTLERLRPQAPLAVESVPEGPLTVRWLSAYVPLVTALDREAAESIARVEYDRLLADGDTVARAQFDYTLGLAALVEGRPMTAASRFRACRDASGIWHDSWLPTVLARLVEALVLAGDRPAALRAHKTLLSVHSAPMHEVARRLAEAALRADSGDVAGAGRSALAAAVDAAKTGDVLGAFDAAYAGVRFGDTGAARLLLDLGPLPDGAARQAQRAHARALLARDVSALEHAADGLGKQGLAWYAVEARSLAASLRGRGGGGAVQRERVRALLRELPELRGAVLAEGASVALTAREQEVARLAAAGVADRRIAERMGVSVRTVHAHLGNVYGKLGVHSRAELAPLVGSPGEQASPPSVQ